MEPTTLTHDMQPDVPAKGVGASDDASEVPMPLKALSLEEERIWQRVSEDLKRYGLIHRTDAMLMHVIVSTFVDWVNTEAELEKHKTANDGSIMTKTPNGYVQPHAAFYEARKLKNDLLRVLPEACLTIPSFAKVKQAMREPEQQDLFDPLVAFVSGKPAAPRLVHSR